MDNLSAKQEKKNKEEHILRSLYRIHPLVIAVSPAGTIVRMANKSLLFTIG